MEKFKAVHINTGSEPWKEKLGRTSDRLMKEGILSKQVWQEVQRIRSC